MEQHKQADQDMSEVLLNEQFAKNSQKINHQNNERSMNEKTNSTRDGIIFDIVPGMSNLSNPSTNTTTNNNITPGLEKPVGVTSLPASEIPFTALSPKNNARNTSSPKSNVSHISQHEANRSNKDKQDKKDQSSEELQINGNDNVYDNNRYKVDESSRPKTRHDQSLTSNQQSSLANNVANKPNGLKNRVRPPPIDIGKVSNFSIDDRPSTTQDAYPLNKQSIYNVDATEPAQMTHRETHNSSDLLKPIQTQRSDQTSVQHNNWQSSNTNLKFWSKLNDSYYPTVTNRTPNNNYINNNSMASSQSEEHSTASEINEDQSRNDERDSIMANGNSKIINGTHENGFTIDDRVKPKRGDHLHEINGYSHESKHEADSQDTSKLNSNHIEDRLDLTSHHPRAHEPSTSSDQDDSTTHAVDVAENGGGNVIGVDNSTPPASTNLADQLEEQSASANSLRSKSNNPFLVSEDEVMPALPDLNNFHRRPASFMAATTSNIKSKQQATLDNVMNRSQHNHLCEQLNNLTIINDSSSRQNLPSLMQNHNNEWNDVTTTLIPEAINGSAYNTKFENIIQDPRRYMDMSGQITSNQDSSIPQSIYGNSFDIIKNNQQSEEPTISADSENAIGKHPPSSTLPHWVDAIYELNNAILEPSSIGGGAENGQFIYLTNSGDIILELNQIKVSGFTLAEFNELVESKATHLLSAVQTKHSHSLTCDLKEYLSCSFPKNSPDKVLQDLIRENIYRRTIPCTTRPPRPGEVDKIDYHFLKIEQFNDLNERGLLLEFGLYGGHHYGTLRPSCEITNTTAETLTKSVPEAVERGVDNTPVILGIQDQASESQIYENHTVFKQYHQQQHQPDYHPIPATQNNINNLPVDINHSNIFSGNDLPLPLGWEKVEDPIHGTFYIDHNTQKTQYERPYEIELTKGYMGFGFTLIEADNGMLLVRSIIPDGPAYHNGIIRPGDILISAVGISVSVLQHTDIAKLFSAFAVGDRVRLTFGRTNYVLGDNLANLVPDEYLFSNGSNGDMAFAINPAHPNFKIFQDSLNLQHNNILDVQIPEQDVDILKISLRKSSEQGFGFTLGESNAGQRVKEIQNASSCMNLKQGDTLLSINEINVTQMSHKEVVSLLKECPVGEMLNLTVKRRSRFRSKTPMVTHSDHYRSSMIHTQQRNCRTPSFDGMIDRQQHRHSIATMPRMPTYNNDYMPLAQMPQVDTYVPPSQLNILDDIHYKYRPISDYQPAQVIDERQSFDGCSMATSNVALGGDPNDIMNGVVNQPPPINMDYKSIQSLYSGDYKRTDEIAQTNSYNNFMKNDKLMMMQMQQQKYQPVKPQTPQVTMTHQSEDYRQIPLYSNAELMRSQSSLPGPPPPKPNYEIYGPEDAISYPNDYQNNNYYANNEEIAIQRSLAYKQQQQHQQSFDPEQYDLNCLQQTSHQNNNLIPLLECKQNNGDENPDEYEYHNIDLIRENINSNWGIRLIGGAEVNRAISIGSVVFGGAAFENGQLKSGDEIISINGIQVVGSTHQNVVELISTCANRASLVIRRKKFAEACEVILTRSLDEGFGFVIISSCDCVSLIGKIIDGSPAQRCQQLHVKDRIIAVNGREITPKMRHSEIVNMIKETGSVLRLKIIPANCYTVELIKNSPNDNFGFTMRGGSEYDGAGLYILRVAPTGLARDLLNVGDQIIEINQIPTVGMTHQQAASIIMHSDPIVKLKLRRNHQIPPSLLVDSPRELHKFNQVTAEIKTVSMTPNGKVDRTYECSVTTPPNNFIPAMINQQQISNAYQQQQDNINDLGHQNGMPLYAT